MTSRWFLVLTVISVILTASCGTNGGGQNSGAASSGRARSTPSTTIASRVPIPTSDGYLGLAVDGHGNAWFAESNSGRLGRYRRGEPIQEIALQANAQPRTLRSAPDGSVWFAEPGLGRLGRIGLDGHITERQLNAGEFYPNWGVAVGPDGSVWYDAARSTGRLRPDGTNTSYDIAGDGPITVDSRGNAWVPGHMVQISLISDSGEISEFKVANGIEQVAEATDGHMWFVDVTGGPASPRIGFIDSNGQTKFFDAVNADVVGFPNSIVRAPDGAVWFGTSDGRLIRLASESDVTVYNLPWPDAAPGPFVVLNGNRVVMVGDREVLDFVAGNGQRVAGAQAIPTALPHVGKDAAEAAAYAAARDAAGPVAKIVFTGQSWEGDHAAEFVYSINPNRFGYALVVYVVEEAGAWRKYDTFGTQNLQPPTPGLKEVVKFRSGCLNVHSSPSKVSKVVACLGSGSEIEIDGLPAYADGFIWWHLVSRGWAAHPFLFRTDYVPTNRAMDC